MTSAAWRIGHADSTGPSARAGGTGDAGLDRAIARRSSAASIGARRAPARGTAVPSRATKATLDACSRSRTKAPTRASAICSSSTSWHICNTADEVVHHLPPPAPCLPSGPARDSCRPTRATARARRGRRRSRSPRRPVRRRVLAAALRNERPRFERLVACGKDLRQREPSRCRAAPPVASWSSSAQRARASSWRLGDALVTREVVAVERLRSFSWTATRHALRRAPWHARRIGRQRCARARAAGCRAARAAAARPPPRPRARSVSTKMTSDRSREQHVTARLPPRRADVAEHLRTDREPAARAAPRAPGRVAGSRSRRRVRALEIEGPRRAQAGTLQHLDEVETYRLATAPAACVASQRSQISTRPPAMDRDRSACGRRATSKSARPGRAVGARSISTGCPVARSMRDAFPDDVPIEAQHAMCGANRSPRENTPETCARTPRAAGPELAGTSEYNRWSMLRFLTAGESHGRGLVAILDGVPAGLAIDFDRITDGSAAPPGRLRPRPPDGHRIRSRRVHLRRAARPHDRRPRSRC